jgi:hypothetical protein
VGNRVERRFFQEGAEFFQADVKEEADVGDGEAGDVGDFFVAEVVLEFEADDFALVGGEGVEESEQGVGGVAGISERGRGRGCG